MQTPEFAEPFDALKQSSARSLFEPGNFGLVVSTNGNPVMVAAKGYFRERRFKKMAALGAVTAGASGTHWGDGDGEDLGWR